MPTTPSSTTPSATTTQASRTTRRRGAIAAAGLACVALLSACGGAQAAAPTASAPQPSNGSPQSGRRSPGVRGLIAAANGPQLQVQSDNQQTTVDVTVSTTITKSQTGTAADVTVGSCVMARGADGATGTSWTAASISITFPTGCAPRTPPADHTSDPARTPNPNRTANPNRTPDPNRTGAPGAMVMGTVKSVDGGTVVITPSVGLGGAGGASSQSQSDVTVTQNAQTTYTKEVVGTQGDLVVGQCVQVQGKPDQTGAVAATSVALSAPANGQCAGGMGGRGGRRG